MTKYFYTGKMVEDSKKIGDLILTKFVNEEIMTKSEFQLSIDRIMDRHEANFNKKFDTFRFEIKSEMLSMEERIDRQFLKIDARYNWIIGLVVTSTIGLGVGLGGMLLRILSMLPHA